MKVFMGLCEIAGYYANLKEGLQSHGVEVTFIDLQPHKFEYGGYDTPNLVVRLAQKAFLHLGASQVLLKKLFWAVLCVLLSVPLFMWAFFQFDVFIFSFNSTFLFYWELPLLKLAGKKIIYVFHGTDERPPYINGVLINAERRTTKQLIKLTKRRKKQLKTIGRYADVIISNPLSSHFHERPCVCYWLLGVPTKERLNVSPPLNKDNGAVRILHAPSRPEVKGTMEIREAIRKLQMQGHAIEYIEMSNRSHSEVVEELRRCDFVIDQLYSDTPMATFAAEAASFGKPAIIGGYELVGLKDMFPEAQLPPSYLCEPAAIAEAIENLIVDEALRRELGMKAQAFIETHWTSEIVAKGFLDLINGDTPSEYIFEPHSISFVHGVGLSRARLREAVRSVLDSQGPSALCLTDKPALKQLFIELADDEGPQ